MYGQEGAGADGHEDPHTSPSFLSAKSCWSHLSSHFPVVGICCGGVTISVRKQHVSNRDLRVVAWIKHSLRAVGGQKRKWGDLVFRPVSDGPVLQSRDMTGPGFK